MPARAKRPRGLVIELHGSGLDPRRQLRSSGLANELWSRNFALILPQAQIRFQLMPGEPSGFAWNVPGTPLPGEADLREEMPDDVDWITRLSAGMREELNATGLPLFLVGYSGGARLASHLISHGPSEWVAAGLVAGLRYVPEGSHAPPPVLAFHGVADPINLYNGGAGPRWDIGVMETATRLAYAQGCVTVPEMSRLAAGIQHIYRRTDGSAGLTQYSIDGQGHAWPGSPDAGHRASFGPCAPNVDATTAIADFFETFVSRDRS